MSITLTQMTDRQRVRIVADSLTADEVRVERSVNELFWQTVRGGVAVEPQSGEIQVDDYEWQSDVTNFYRVVDTDGDTVLESDDITPSLDGAVWLKHIKHPFLNTALTVVDFTDPALPERGGLFPVAGRSNAVSVSDVRTGFVFEVEVVTDTPTAARDMQLTIKSGHDFFLQVPAGCPVPGGYVRVGDVQPQRGTRSARSPRRYWRLPCTVVAAPGSLVVGGTMTYGGLLNLYGGYNAVLAAHSEYAELLELMASPDDLVVL